jgi:hypothetical protein
LIEAGYPWEDMVKSVEEFRNRQSDIPDQVADSVAGQNILVDLRIGELLDTAAKLLDRAVRNHAAMAEEGAAACAGRSAQCARLIAAATTPGMLMVPGDLVALARMATPRRLYGSRLFEEALWWPLRGLCKDRADPVGGV